MAAVNYGILARDIECVEQNHLPIDARHRYRRARMDAPKQVE